MDLRGLRVGYVPYSVTLTRLGDRRRFCYYAEQRGLRFEIADPSQEYDLVVVTPGGDISVWSRYARGRAKIIYEQIDSYLSIPKLDLKGALRGVAKFFTRQNRYLLLDYTKGIQDMCRRADAVICSTAAQQRQISEFCSNVHAILDFHEGVVRSVKTDYSAGATFNLVWEGLPGNLRYFSEIAGAFRKIQEQHKVALHVVTDLEFGQYLDGRFSRKQTVDVAKGICDRVYVYAWNELLLSRIVTACDLALIPLPLGDPLYAGKPENKLLLFWRMGMPAVVSATTAYSQAMERCGLSMACANEEEWRRVLDRYMNDQEARREAGTRGRAYVEAEFSEARLLQQWDEVVESVLGGVHSPPSHASSAEHFDLPA